MKTSAATVLCSSFNIAKVDDFNFGCHSNFTEEDCNKTVIISLEAWTTSGQLIMTSSKPVSIECDVEPVTEVYEEEETIPDTSSYTKSEINIDLNNDVTTKDVTTEKENQEQGELQGEVKLHKTI